MAAEPPVSPARNPRPPWREIALAAGLASLGWHVLFLVFVFPLALFLALLRGPLGRLAPAVMGPAILLLTLQFPGVRFFVLAAALSLVCGVAALRYGTRVGYPELSLCVVMGIAAAAALWALGDPAFFHRFGSSVEASILEDGREVVRRLTRTGKPDARSLIVLDQALAAFAKLSARSWPAATFAALWLGAASALALAVHWAGNGSGLAAKVRVRERCALFRLPDLWVWVFLASVASFLTLPAGSAPQDAALNAALVSAGLYAWQGLAIALYFLERRRIRAPGRVLIVGAFVFLLPLPAFVLALGLGLADVGFNLRFREPVTPEP